jgi:hypothetical protein
VDKGCFLKTKICLSHPGRADDSVIRPCADPFAGNGSGRAREHRYQIRKYIATGAKRKIMRNCVLVLLVFMAILVCGPLPAQAKNLTYA